MAGNKLGKLTSNKSERSTTAAEGVYYVSSGISLPYRVQMGVTTRIIQTWHSNPAEETNVTCDFPNYEESTKCP